MKKGRLTSSLEFAVTVLTLLALLRSDDVAESFAWVAKEWSVAQAYTAEALDDVRKARAASHGRGWPAATYLTLGVLFAIIAVLLLGAADHVVRRRGNPASWAAMHLGWTPLYSWYAYVVSSCGDFEAIWWTPIRVTNLFFTFSGLCIAIGTWGYAKRSVSIALIALNFVMLTGVFFLQAHLPHYAWLMPLPGAAAMHVVAWRLSLAQRGRKRWRCAALLYAPVLGGRTLIPHEFHALVVYLVVLLALKIALWLMLVERDAARPRPNTKARPGVIGPRNDDRSSAA